METASNGEDFSRGPTEEGWQLIGMPDRAVDVARSAFATPDQAKPWVDALQRYVPEPDILRSIVDAGIEPDEFVRWRVAAVDSRNIVGWSALLRAAGLGPEHVERWRAAKLNVPTLPLIAPYLTEGFGFDDVLDVLSTWDVHKSPGSTTPPRRTTSERAADGHRCR